jgi:hypothetical protein
VSSINFGADAFGSSDYAPLPEGTYNANVFEVEIVQVKNGENAGKDQFKVQFKVADGEFSNRRLFTYVPLYAGKASWKTVAFFKALGYEPKPGEPFTIPTPNELAGKSLGIKVKVVPSQDGGQENNINGFTATSNVESLLSAVTAKAPASSDDLWA